MSKAAIINDTGGKGHFGCDLVMHQLRRELAAAGISEVWSHPVGEDWQPIANDLLARPAVDLVIVNGEGSIHHSTSRDRARFLPAIAPFAKQRLRARAYLINATIYEIDSSVVEDLRAFDAIYVRDTGSQRELAKYGIESQYVADLTVGADIAASSKRQGICVTDSIVKEVAAKLGAMAAAKGWIIRGMHQKKKWLRTWPSWLRTPPDFRDFASFLSSHELVITGRYHTTTMCLATQTPFIAVESNTPKISWLLDDVFGNRRRLIAPGDIERLDTADFLRWTEAELQAVGRARERARASAAGMFAEMNSSFAAA